MRLDMMEVLACPLCKSGLALHITSQTDEEVTAGTLTCEQCPEKYPVQDGVPNLLPAEYRAS